jgi:hypothetical protein
MHRGHVYVLTTADAAKMASLVASDTGVTGDPYLANLPFGGPYSYLPRRSHNRDDASLDLFRRCTRCMNC